MPLVNTWIKNEDWDKYYKLASTKQWGEFIHNALNGNVLAESHGDHQTVEEHDKNLHKYIKTPKTIADLKVTPMSELSIPRSRQNMEPIPKSFSARKKK